MDALDLTRDNAALLAIDVQDRFQGIIPGIVDGQPCARALQRLAAGSTLLGIPAVISEQYPEKLGATLPYLRQALPDAPVLAKTHFSCMDDAALRACILEGPLERRSHLIVAGVEAHVCLLATVADLIAAGRWVVVAADAVASRDPANRDLALAAMRDLGALVVPVETILFRIQRQSGVGAFKALSALVK